MAPFQSILHVTWKGIQAGQFCETKLYYAQDNPHSSITSQAVVSAAYTQHWSAWKELISNRFEMIQLTGQYAQYDPIIVKTPYVSIFSEFGEIDDSEALPPNLVIDMLKAPDPTTTLPEDVTAFKQGFNGFSGIPENAQNNGFVTSDALTDWGAFFETLESLTMTVGGSPEVYNLCMVRQLDPVPTPPALQHAYVYVEETSVRAALGTRQSRKIGT